MNITIQKSAVKGKLRVPSSKSLTIRALMCAALAKGTSEIQYPLVSDDSNAAADVLGKLGVIIENLGDTWRVTGGKFKIPTEDLYCGESATTLRFIMAICSLLPGRFRILGGPSLNQRPVRSLVDALKQLGINATMESKVSPPVTVQGGTLSGNLAEIPGNISSQFVSALLLIAPFAKEQINIKLTTQMSSKSYILMTLWVLRKFGINVQSEWDRFIVRRQKYQPCTIKIEGDWSSASYFLALGALSEEGVQVENLNTSSLQGDKVILDHLRTMGAVVGMSGDTVNIRKGRLKAIRADLSDCIDLLPTLSVLAALAEGTSELVGIERARIKESNRVTAVAEGLKKLGITVQEERSRLTIVGLKAPRKTDGSEEEPEPENKPEESISKVQRPVVVINSYNDHRIAMAFGVIGTELGNVTIQNAECVNKTYPDFWQALNSIGGEFELDA
jgi:3-phosphoshikimate 1-carboxyvinyltransferase